MPFSTAWPPMMNMTMPTIPMISVENAVTSEMPVSVYAMLRKSL